ncbi:uncharacterized protein PHACADRAFT_248407 [Phanerochaete carnosa HHB-10118-sp]|uniref:BTB domain-containing protein n=1 Tax=Phanerochaete carnosa (strain HHB-10118-sp) TaxID=650164 RepID=K5WQX9_PHACS|nr:uncharacterized protein PHACADRAFT_248407 [Phanerochaete carnosa HHB-10118-sp]EKM61664.1 hypothetical protein PHACADRAFT_248407 [Phanerochaete carnosa HHB-10118-sp]
MVFPAQHHPTLYFEDGNVVLSAVAADGQRRYFRVHRSILCRYSPVLEEMFQIPPADDECYDGVLHVEMPDSAEELGSLLGVLYDPLGTAYKRFCPNTPVLVHGTLKLAIKYECEALRSRVVENIEADWPQTLAQWDARRQETIIARSEHYLRTNGKVDGLYLDDRLPEPASTIRIASDFNIPSILPAAFYQLSLISTDADWDGYRTNLTTEGKHLRFGARTARWKLLDKRDLMRLVHGQKLLAAYTRAIGTDIFGIRCPRNSQGCSRARSDCWKYMQENAPVSMDDPLEILHDCMSLNELFTNNDLPCETCTSEISQLAEKKRRELWRSLPAFFNLA